MPGTFTGVLAAQLNRYSAIPVREAEDGDVVRPRLALVAPGGHHLLVSSGLRITLRKGTSDVGHCPSIDVTMESASQTYGSLVRGVVLTGMGDDGAQGLAAIRARGGTTFAQDAESCVVNGMPQRAIERGVVDHIGSPARIAELLVRECTDTEGNTNAKHAFIH